MKHTKHMLRFTLQFMLAYLYNLISVCNMPKCQPDLDLQDRVRRFIKNNCLSVGGAAAELGVDRTTFWRFCSSGRARNDTKALYLEALEKRNKSTLKIVSNDAVKTDERIGHALSFMHEGLTGQELKLIRKACEGVLVLIDAYEAQGLGKDI